MVQAAVQTAALLLVYPSNADNMVAAVAVVIVATINAILVPDAHKRFMTYCTE